MGIEEVGGAGVVAMGIEAMENPGQNADGHCQRESRDPRYRWPSRPMPEAGRDGDIERLLGDIASELRNVPSNSSPSDVERTMAYVGQVHDKARELVTSVGALNAALGVWPTRTMGLGDTWLIRTVIDTPTGDIPLGMPAYFEEQTSLLAKWIRFRGRTYARHPRWGTYLNAAHLAAIGGVERIQAAVAPAAITSSAT